MFKSNRRNFLKISGLAGIGLGFGLDPYSYRHQRIQAPKGKRVGIIGLDTSHSIAFTKTFNDPLAGSGFGGFIVVAAYPHGSRDIKSSVERIVPNTQEITKYGVRIVDSIKELLAIVDVVLLETNDGRLHLDQVLPVLQAGKPVFIDKPVAASLKDAVAIFDAAERYQVPVFSASSLRYMSTAQEVAKGKWGRVKGADTFSPAFLEETHPDLFWYGVHGVETLFTVLGAGCKKVSRFHTEDTDIVVGEWEDGRMGTFRGMRSGELGYGGMAFCEKGIRTLGPYEGYDPLLLQIARFFETGVAPVSAAETIEIFAFMEAADESKRRRGAAVDLEGVLMKAREENRKG